MSDREYSDSEVDVQEKQELEQSTVTHRFIPPPPPEQVEEPVVKYPSKRLTSRTGQALSCAVCRSNPSKYKFKCCLFGFCSAACFKAHGDCQQPVVRSTLSAVRSRYIDPFADLDILPEDILTKEQLEKLSSDPAVLSLLQHPKLRKVISRIDSCRDRHSALERQMQNDAAFVQVVHAIANAIQAPLTQL